jgi:hypothetical protein
MSITTEAPRLDSDILLQDPRRPQPRSTWSIDALAPILLFVVAACVYLKTLCPTIFADDCGEIATAVASGGVMHPPGYPLYTLIGRLFVMGIPTGEPAWRLGIFSVLAAAGAVAMTYKLARRAGALPVWSIASALGFAFSLSLWRQATKVETYALNALFVTFILNSAAAFNQSGKTRDLLATALLCGLSLTNHLSIICLMPAAAWLVIGRLRAVRSPIAAIAGAAALVIAPLGLYGLAWIAAAQHQGGQVWGDPSNTHRFFLQVSGARYRAYFMNQSWLDMAQRDLVDLPALLWRNLGWFLIGVVPGAARGLMLPANRRFNQAMLIALAVYAVETSAYGILNIFEYYTPIILLLCIWAGVGMDAVVSGLAVKFNRTGWALRPIQIGLVAAVCVGAAASHWSACDRSHATFIRDLAVNTLRTMPPNAVLLSVGDNRNFPIWYVQDILGCRRDVTLVPRNMLAGLGTPDGRDEMGWLLEKMQRQHPDIVDAASILAKCAASPAYAGSEGPTWDIATRALSLGRPVLLTDIEPTDLAYSTHHKPVMTAIGPNLSLEPYGLANLIVPSATMPNVLAQATLNIALERQVAIASAPDALMQDEPDGNMTNEVYAQMLYRGGDLLSRSDDYRGAYMQTRASLALNPTASAYDELGFLCFQIGRLDESLKDCSMAVSLEPGNADYQMHLQSDQQIINSIRAANRHSTP